MRMKWTVAAMIAAAGIPAVGAAQQPTADSAKQGTAAGRRVNQTNEDGDTTRSALRDSVLRNSTNTNAAAPTGAGSTRSSSANSREGQSGAAQPGGLADSARSMQAAESGRPVIQTNEGGDTTRSALRDSLLRSSTRTAGTAIAPSTDASGARSGGGASAGGMGGAANLTRAQMRQLQTALNGAGCNAGRADGQMGRRTREAMACARQKNGISGNDDQALFRALGLSF